MKRITELLYLKVVNEDGKILGRVFDFRCPGDPEHGIGRKDRVVGELIYGAAGLSELLGLRKVEEKRVSWKAVRAVKKGMIIIDEKI